MKVASILAVATVAIALTAAPAHDARADPDAPADQLAAEAQALAAAGDLIGAAAKFRAAYAIDPRSELLCNVGVAYHKARDLPRAQLYLGRCLTRAGSLDADFAASVRTVFAAVEDKLRAGGFAPIDVTVTPESATFTVSWFDPEDAIVGARLVWLPFGRHTIVVRAEGHVEQSIAIEVAGTTQQSARVVLVRSPAPDPIESIGVVPIPIEPRPQPSRTPALIASVSSGALALGAVGIYVLARSTVSDAGETGISATEYATRVDRARFRQRLSWGLGAAAAAGAVVSGYLWYRATRTTATTLDVAPTAGGATASIRRSF